MAQATVDSPDEVLVIAAIMGNLEAFNELASRYRAAVVRTAQGIVGREYAEDVAQDALLLAFKALPSIDEPKKFAAWLSAITRHRALRFGKREGAHLKRQVAIDDLLLEKLDALARPFVDSSGNDELRRALENVPEDYALVLKLQFLDDVPLKRIAAFLGAPLSTIKWRSRQGKKLLRQELELLRNREQ